MTYRPGFHPPWMDKSYVTHLTLRRLNMAHSLSLIEDVAAQRPLSSTVMQRIATRAEGHPLFLEALTRMLLERGSAAGISVPDTIQEVLMARIDGLSAPARRLLQTAAVLGRTASLELLQQVAQGIRDFAQALQELKRLEFLYEQTMAAEPSYAFRHGLIQDVTYQSLLQSHRETIHTAVGQALETRYADRLATVYDRLAYHYARTPDAAKAVQYLTRLAERAVNGSAHVEAVEALQEARRHAERLSADTRDQHLVHVVIHLVHSLHFLSRFPESLTLLLQYQHCLAQLQVSSLIGVYHLQLGVTYSMLGEHTQAVQQAQRALEVATECGDEITMGRAHYLWALEAYWAGQPQQGIAHGQQAVALLQRSERRWSLGMAYIYLGVNYVLQGDFALALEAVQQARTLGEVLEDVSLQNHATWIVGWVQATCGDWQAGIAACEQALERSPAPLNTLFALCALGHAYLEKEDPEQAILHLTQAIEQTQHFHHQPLQTWMTTLLAEAYLLQGDSLRAQSLARQALDMATTSHNLWGIGLAQHALGRIARARGALLEVATHLTEALHAFTAMPAHLKVAQVQLDLAHLAQAQGDLPAARQHLHAAQTGFTALHVPLYLERTRQLASRLDMARPRAARALRCDPPD